MRFFRSGLLSKKEARFAMDQELAAVLGALKATGHDSFEALINSLLERLLGEPLSPFASGWQAGKDSETTDQGKAVQCKRYKNSPSAKELCGDLTLAANASDELEIWIAACLAVISAKPRSEIAKTAAARGVQVVIVHGIALEALIFRYPKVARDFLPGFATLPVPSSQRIEEQAFRLSLIEREIASLPLPNAVRTATKDYLRSQLDGRSLGLGRRLSLVNYIEREQESELDNWWSKGGVKKPLVLLAGEGMGKTTMVANWVVSRPEMPALWISPQDVGEKATIDDLIVSRLKNAGDFTHFQRDRKFWGRRVSRWLQAGHQRLLVVLDGFNVITDTLLAASVIDDMFKSKWLKVVSFIVTGRPEWWKKVTSQSQRLEAKTLEVREYNDSELRAALNELELSYREIPGETEDLFRIPLLFESIRVEASCGVEVRYLTREAIYWLGLRQRLSSGVGLVRGLRLETDRDIKNFLSDLAERFLERRDAALLITREDAQSAARSFLSATASLAHTLDQLKSAEFLREHRNRFQVNQDMLVLGFGLVLLYQALDASEREWGLSGEQLVSKIEVFLEPETGLERNAIEAALIFSLSEEETVSLASVRLALLICWIRSKNFSGPSERVFSYLLPRMTVSFLDLAEYIWKDWNAFQRIRSLLVKGLLELIEQDAEASALSERLDKWLRLAHKAHSENAVLPSYRQATTDAGGLSTLIRRLSLVESECDPQTNLYFVAMALVSAAPSARLYPSIVRSKVAGELSGRGEVAELSSWTAAVSLGLNFYNFLQAVSFEDSSLLEAARKRYLEWCQMRSTGANSLANEDLMKESFFEDLADTELSSRFFLGKHRASISNARFAEVLTQHPDASAGFKKLIRGTLANFDLTSADWTFWRHRSQTRGTLLWKDLDCHYVLTPHPSGPGFLNSNSRPWPPNSRSILSSTVLLFLGLSLQRRRCSRFLNRRFGNCQPSASRTWKVRSREWDMRPKSFFATWLSWQKRRMNCLHTFKCCLRQCLACFSLRMR